MIYRFLLTVITALAALACAPAAPPAPTAPPKAAAPAPKSEAQPAPKAAPAKAELTPLGIGLVGNLGNPSPWVGLEKGIYLKHGIDLKIKILTAAPDTVKAIQTGETQLGNMSFGTLALSRNQDIKVKTVGLIVSDATTARRDNTLAIIARPDSGITKVEDLVGKRLGTSAGVTPDFYLRAVLARAGVADNKVEFVNVQQANALAGLRSGLDAVSVAEPYGEQILAELPGSQVVQRGGGLIAQRTIIVGMDDWIAANGPLLERFAAATAESSQYIRANMDEAADISSRWLSGIDPVVLRRSIRHLTFDPRISQAVREGWEYDLTTLVNRGALKTMMPFDEGVDVPLLENLPKKYPQFFNDLPPLP
jgi:ABC-type nitrate/sulfonate/bicarbonate transport system substrate-binding protein